jgi:membrane protease YdiL (CAAX protease family)
VSEISLAYLDRRVGLAMEAVLLLTLLIHGSETESQPMRAALWGVAIVPIIRMVTLCLPQQLPILYLIALAGSPILLAATIATRASGYSTQDVGLRVTLRQLPRDLFLVPLGLVLGAADYLVLRPPGLSPRLAWEDLWLPIAVLVIFTALGEELLFRGLIQRAAIDVLGRRGLPFVAVLYASTLSGTRSAVHIVLGLLMSLICTWIVLQTGSILGAILAHASVNVCLFVLAPRVLAGSAVIPTVALTTIVAIAVPIVFIELRLTFLSSGSIRDRILFGRLDHPPSLMVQHDLK